MKTDSIKRKSLTSILDKISFFENKDDTFIHVHDTKKQITYKINYSDLLKCIKQDINNV